MRRRIKSVKNTQQITKAMKMVAAAKLKRAQDRVTSSRPYAGKMSDVLGGLSAKIAEEGFNALVDKYENLVEAGVIDPTKVVRSALQNASSIASLLLTTEALVSEIPEDKPEPAGGGHGGGMPGGMY